MCKWNVVDIFGKLLISLLVMQFEVPKSIYTHHPSLLISIPYTYDRHEHVIILTAFPEIYQIVVFDYSGSECRESCSGDGDFPSVCKDSTYYVRCINLAVTLKRCGQYEVFVPSEGKCGELIFFNKIAT